jgi:hypothetical protein
MLNDVVEHIGGAGAMVPVLMVATGVEEVPRKRILSNLLLPLAAVAPSNVMRTAKLGLLSAAVILLKSAVKVEKLVLVRPVIVVSVLKVVPSVVYSIKCELKPEDVPRLVYESIIPVKPTVDLVRTNDLLLLPVGEAVVPPSGAKLFPAGSEPSALSVLPAKLSVAIRL